MSLHDMRLSLVLALLAVCSPVIRAAADFDTLMQQGRAALGTGNLTAASESFGQACGAELLLTYLPARVAYCEHHLATLSSARGEPLEAEQHYLRALSQWKLTGNAQLSSYCASLMNLGELYRRLHREADGEEILRRAEDLARKVEAARPELIAEVLSRLGVMYQETVRPEPACTALTEAVARFTKLQPPLPAEEAYARNGLGMVQLAFGLQRDAEANLREATTLATAALGEDHFETVAYQTNLALALLVTGQFDRANLLLRRAKMLLEARGLGSVTQMGLILAELSAAAAGENKLGIAEEYGQQALTVLLRQKEPNRTAVALARVNLADVYLRSRRLDEAGKLLPDAIATERELQPDTRLLADGIRRLAELRALQHSWREAQDLYREAIAIYERRMGADNPALAPALRGYADALRHDGGSKSEVKTLEARARAVSALLPRS